MTRQSAADWPKPLPPSNIRTPNNNPRCWAYSSIGPRASSIPGIVRLLTVDLVKSLNNSTTEFRNNNGPCKKSNHVCSGIYLSVSNSIKSVFLTQ